MSKLHKAFLFLCAAALVSSCEILSPQPSGLSGKWILEEAQCYCFFEEGFDFKGNTLDFDTITSRLEITAPDDSWFVKPEGTYAYQIKGEELEIDGDKGYTFELSGSILKLHFIDEPMIADDELTLIYKR